MYICLCKGITDKQMEEASQNEKSKEAAYKITGMGTGCGTCLMDEQKACASKPLKCSKLKFSVAKNNNR